MPPCAMPATRPRSASTSGAWPSSSATTCTDAVRAFADTDEARALEGERARLLAHWLRDFRRAGHELERRRPRRARAAPHAAGRGGDRLPAQHQRVPRRHRRRRASSWHGLPDAYIERLSPGRAAGHVSGQPRLPRGQPVPRAGARPRPAPRAVPQELEQGRRRQPAAAGRGARRCVAAWPRCWASRPGRTTPWRSRWRARPGARRAFYDELLPPLAGRGPRRARRLAERTARRWPRTARSPPGTGATTTRR